MEAGWTSVAISMKAVAAKAADIPGSRLDDRGLPHRTRATPVTFAKSARTGFGRLPPLCLDSCDQQLQIAHMGSKPEVEQRSDHGQSADQCIDGGVDCHLEEYTPASAKLVRPANIAHTQRGARKVAGNGHEADDRIPAEINARVWNAVLGIEPQARAFEALEETGVLTGRWRVSEGDAVAHVLGA